MPMLLSIEFSKKPLICLDLTQVKDEHASSICDLLRVNGGMIGALTSDIDMYFEETKPIINLIKEIGKSQLSEVKFQCHDEGLVAQMVKSA